LKNIIFFSFLIFSSYSHAEQVCSKNGTRIIYTNGIITPREKAQLALDKIEEFSLNSDIDTKKVWPYTLAYNYQESLSKDLLEAVVQRFPKKFLKDLGAKNPYAAYQAYLNGALSGSGYTNELNSITEAALFLMESYIKKEFNSELYFKTVAEIKSIYEQAFIKGERILAISHSQGGLFMRDVFNLINNTDKYKFFSALQVASPLNEAFTSKFLYATHKKDRVINSIRLLVGALPAKMDTPLIVSNGFEGISDFAIDFVANHGMVTTYLHDSVLKPQVKKKIIGAASLLESNCETYEPENDMGFSQIENILSPSEGAMNRIDFDVLTAGMDNNTKANTRLRLLVYPSLDEALVEGFENVSVSLSSRDGKINDIIWDGDGFEPEVYDLFVEMNRYDPFGKEAFVEIKNNGQNILPIYTTVIPEIKKRICYSGPETLRVTFARPDIDSLEDYPKLNELTISSDQCKDIYLAYNVPYFYEFLVITSSPEAVGYISNWDQVDGFIYNYKVFNADPWAITAKLNQLVPDSEEYYNIQMTWKEDSAGNIVIAPVN